MAAEISYRGRTRPAYAIAVAERLADEHDEGALYRKLEDGTIEVAVMQKGVLTRHMVDDRGTTLSVEAAPRSLKYTLGKMIMVAGLFGFIALSVWVAWAALLILPTLLAGGMLSQAGKLQARLGHGEWKPIPVLAGWEPRTWEQLRAVEELLDENEHRVFVRPHDTRSVEVAAMKYARFSWYRVDESGETTLLETAGRKYAPYAAMDPLRKQLRKRGLDPADWIAVSRHSIGPDDDDDG